MAKKKSVRKYYDVRVRLTGTRSVKIVAQSAMDAVEAAQKPIRLDDGIILFCEAESVRQVAEGD